jgi:hypothetical protein
MVYVSKESLGDKTTRTGGNKPDERDEQRLGDQVTFEGDIIHDSACSLGNAVPRWFLLPFSFLFARATDDIFYIFIADAPTVKNSLGTQTMPIELVA